LSERQERREEKRERSITLIYQVMVGMTVRSICVSVLGETVTRGMPLSFRCCGLLLMHCFMSRRKWRGAWTDFFVSEKHTQTQHTTPKETDTSVMPPTC